MIPVISLLLIRRQISQRSMWSFGVIEAIDIFEDRLVELIVIMVITAVGFFFLKILEKALAAGIVKRIAFLREGLHNIQLIQYLFESVGCILRAPVGVEHQAIRASAEGIGFPKGFDHQFAVGSRGQFPGDDFPGEEIHDNTKVIPLAGGFQIGDITYPDQVRRFLIKLLVQMIMISPVIMLCGAVMRFVCGHGGQLHGVHQAVHSSDADVDAIVALEDIGDLVGSDTFVTVGVDLQDRLLDALVFFDPGSGFGIEVLVISASIHVQNTAERLDAVLETELMDRV